MGKKSTKGGVCKARPGAIDRAWGYPQTRLPRPRNGAAQILWGFDGYGPFAQLRVARWTATRVYLAGRLEKRKYSPQLGVVPRSK